MFPVLADLRAQGVVGAVGAGMNQWQMLGEFARHADFDCFLLAGRYTLLEQTSLDFLELCGSKGIAVILGGVFNSGILATGPVPHARYQYAEAPASILERAARLETACRRHGVPLRRAALRFALAHPAVTCAVLGAESPEEFEEHAAGLADPIPADLWDELRRQGLIAPEAPLPVGAGG
jgi:D-threo-aldose 1-dehydrogenase